MRLFLQGLQMKFFITSYATKIKNKQCCLALALQFFSGNSLRPPELFIVCYAPALVC